MPNTKLRSLTITSKGQITISARARKALQLDKGDTLIEMLVGNCLVLMPEQQILSETMKKAQEALRAAGVTPDEMLEESKSVRKAKLKERYPNL
jgi:bifunctional DNA-binding transcriptional regulator/antitoxin component of YhaV-PrlF toxin-antitoxin module